MNPICMLKVDPVGGAAATSSPVVVAGSVAEPKQSPSHETRSVFCWCTAGSSRLAAAVHGVGCTVGGAEVGRFVGATDVGKAVGLFVGASVVGDRVGFGVGATVVGGGRHSDFFVKLTKGSLLTNGTGAFADAGKRWHARFTGL